MYTKENLLISECLKASNMADLMGFRLSDLQDVSVDFALQWCLYACAMLSAAMGFGRFFRWLANNGPVVGGRENDITQLPLPPGTMGLPLIGETVAFLKDVSIRLNTGPETTKYLDFPNSFLLFSLIITQRCSSPFFC